MLNDKAVVHNSEMLQIKALEAWKAYFHYTREMRVKRETLTKAIQKVDSHSLLQKYFTALSVSSVEEKKNLADIKQILGESKKERAFIALRDLTQKRKRTKKIGKELKEAKQEELQARAFMKWLGKFDTELSLKRLY